MSLPAVIDHLADGAQSALGEGLVGVYMTGSFALSCADEHSNLDFLVATTDRLDDEQLSAVTALHARLPDLGLPFAAHLEGSYAPLPDLRSPMSVGRAWPYVDNGSRVVEHSGHGNTAHGRWVLREHGLVVTGPSPQDFVAAHSPEALFAESIGVARTHAARAEEHPGELANACYQPHLVLTLCRVLYTASEGEVTGKVAAADWALSRVPPEFRDLIRSAVRDRPDPWTRVYRDADPALVALTRAFCHEVVRMVSS